MAHYVICYYCKQKFDRDKESTVKVLERRYAHEECAKRFAIEKTQEEKDLEELENYIKKLSNKQFIEPKIRKQIKDFRKEYQYTYSGILKTLIYWHEIKGNKPEISTYGLAIVPYVYEQACQYYYSLYVIKLTNSGKNIKEYKNPKTKVIEIFPPKAKEKSIRLFDLDD